MLFHLFCAIIVLLVTLYFRFWTIASLLPTHKIDGIPGIPQGMGEQLFLLESQRYKALQRIEAEYPDAYQTGLISFDLMLNPHVMIMDTELQRESLRRSDDFPKRTIPIGEYLFGNNVLMSEGESWKRYHNLVHSCFGLCNRIRLEIGDREESNINIHALVTSTVFGVMGKFAMGTDFEDFGSADEFHDRYHSVLKYLSTPTIASHILKIHPKKLGMFPYHKKAVSQREGLMNFMQKLLDERRSKLRQMSQEQKDSSKDILSRMIIKAEKGEYSDNEIKEQLFGIFFAGHDTTSASISFLLYHLSKDPELQSRIREEIRSKINQIDNLESVHVTELQSIMPILTASIFETWRLTPPAASSLAREVNNPNGVTLGGVHIPCGTIIFHSFYTSHRNAELWGDDAEDFNPERFLIQTEEGLKINYVQTKKLLTFGSGKHECLGKLFATQQVMLGSLILLNDFQFILPPNSIHKEMIRTRKSASIMAPENLNLIVKSL